jgi:hypothetical protein
VAPRAGLETEARGKVLSPLPGIAPRSPGLPACGQTLHRLSYPAHMDEIGEVEFFSQPSTFVLTVLSEAEACVEVSRPCHL